jgi:hypothetical protein
MKRLLYIARYPALAVLLLLLLALAPAMAQNVVRQGDITDLGIEQKPGDTYRWELYNDSTVNFAQVAGDAVEDGDAVFVGGNTGTDVQVEWKEPGLYFFKVTGLNITGCTNNLKIGMIKVLEALPTATMEADTAVCEGIPITLTVNLTGTGPWDFTYTDGTTDWEVKYILASPYMITVNPGPSVTTEYWIKQVKDKYGTNTTPGEKVIQTINPLPEPSTIYHR